jgi:hypothetical protein
MFDLLAGNPNIEPPAFFDQGADPASAYSIANIARTRTELEMPDDTEDDGSGSEKLDDVDKAPSDMKDKPFGITSLAIHVPHAGNSNAPVTNKRKSVIVISDEETGIERPKKKPKHGSASSRAPNLSDAMLEISEGQKAYNRERLSLLQAKLSADQEDRTLAREHTACTSAGSEKEQEQRMKIEWEQHQLQMDKERLSLKKQRLELEKINQELKAAGVVLSDDM